MTRYWTVLLFILIADGANASDLMYCRSPDPLLATFKVKGGHYSGQVTGGNLFIQNDIPTAPLIRWPRARSNRCYALMMIDFDGNARGAWPDEVPCGDNAPVRHWIVGNIPGALLKGAGYDETQSQSPSITILQRYRPPHIPVVSGRYGLYLFEQLGTTAYAQLRQPITNFDYKGFLKYYKLEDPVCSNFFVGLYTSCSPFDGKPFTGNDIEAIWHNPPKQGLLHPQ